MRTTMRALQFCTLGLMITIAAAISGCASDEISGSGVARSSVGSKILACKAGDQQVQSSRQCLQDGAACYELNNGNWCTGERGNVCPAGSSEVPAGRSCPIGARCIQFGEDLNCAIITR